MATSLNNLAALYDTQGQYATAEPLYQRALVIREKAMSPEHPDVAESLDNLAGLYRAKGQYAKAESFYQRALAIWEKAWDQSIPTWQRAWKITVSYYGTRTVRRKQYRWKLVREQFGLRASDWKLPVAYLG